MTDPTQLESATTALTGMYTTIISTIMDNIVALLPICIPLLAMSAVIGLSIKWFQKISGVSFRGN
jgi:hypothetical protein